MTTQSLYGTSNTEGIDVSTVLTVNATASPEYPAAPFITGTECLGSNNSRWVYVTAAGAITLGDVVCVTKTYTANSLTSTIAATSLGLPLGVASLAAFTTGQYGWVQTQGASPAISLLAGVAPNVQLYSSATAGRVGATSATGTTYAVNGIVATTTSASTAGTYAGILTNPVVGVVS